MTKNFSPDFKSKNIFSLINFSKFMGSVKLGQLTRGILCALSA